MGNWKEVYRSASKRVLRRDRAAPSIQTVSPRPSSGGGTEGVPPSVIGGLFFFAGALAGGFTGFLLMVLGILIFFGGD